MTDGGSREPLTRIALDAMGGDHAPHEVVKGALLAAAEYPVEIILVGREEAVRKELAALGSRVPPRITIVDAREVVEMDDTALAPLRRKKNSSVRICANLVSDGRADAFVSAGNTGATWTSAKAVIGMIEGVSRPALAQVLPRYDGVTLLLDVGASVDPKPSHLREFAVMGHFYAQMVLGVRHPRIGLLSIGEEEGKGNELTRETYQVLKDTGLNFIGNAEGRDIFNGRADVVVTDGFVGNVVLKASEALGEMVWRSLRSEFGSTIVRKSVGALAYPLLKGLKKRMDWAEYGGAPLLGVKGGCIVCHGRSNGKAIKNAIRVAREFALNRIDEKIRERVGALHVREHEGILANR
ncbi:MAG TPA: phosphate acyltransferase PlsX [Thermoanaerobaculia bacterium]|nr:phosphate acyltransferase PlsX [Thermoanaerobaculia bacterium]